MFLPLQGQLGKNILKYVFVILTNGDSITKNCSLREHLEKEKETPYVKELKKIGFERVIAVENSWTHTEYSRAEQQKQIVRMIVDHSNKNGVYFDETLEMVNILYHLEMRHQLLSLHDDL